MAQSRKKWWFGAITNTSSSRWRINRLEGWPRSLTASAPAGTHGGAHHHRTAIEAGRDGGSTRAARITGWGAAHRLTHRLASWRTLLHMANHRSRSRLVTEQTVPACTTTGGIEDHHCHRNKQQRFFHYLHCPHRGTLHSRGLPEAIVGPA